MLQLIMYNRVNNKVRCHKTFHTRERCKSKCHIRLRETGESRGP